MKGYNQKHTHMFIVQWIYKSGIGIWDAYLLCFTKFEHGPSAVVLKKYSKWKQEKILGTTSTFIMIYISYISNRGHLEEETYPPC